MTETERHDQDPVPDKLILAIVQSEDADDALGALTGRGLRVTRLASTGGFLRQGNTTLLVGTTQARVEEALDVLRATCRTRSAHVAVPAEPPSLVHSYLIEVEVGGATVFVMDISHYEQI
jgi:uncharacterized protein YaaQ